MKILLPPVVLLTWSLTPNLFVLSHSTGEGVKRVMLSDDELRAVRYLHSKLDDDESGSISPEETEDLIEDDM